MKPMDTWRSEAEALIVCPRDRKPLQSEKDFLVCAEGHRYRVVEGIPILLISDVEQTHIEGTRALAIAETEDLSQLRQIHLGPGEIDPFVKDSIGATNGGLYQHLVGNLTEYPIPELRLPLGQGKLFLEIGCNGAGGASLRHAPDIGRSELILLSEASARLAEWPSNWEWRPYI